MKRRVPLRAKSRLERGQQPLKRTRIAPVSAKTRQRTPDWEATVEAARRRARGHCEACGHRSEQLDPHHTFKRNNRIPRHWADRVELISAICSDCHRYAELHPRAELQRQLEWIALHRLATSCGWDIVHDYDVFWTPLQILRDQIRREEELAA